MKLTAEQIQEKLTTDDAHADFDVLNFLADGENWEGEITKECVSLDPPIKVMIRPGFLQFLDCEGETADEAVGKIFKLILKYAGQGMKIVANSLTDERKEYVLGDSGRFVPVAIDPHTTTGLGS